MFTPTTHSRWTPTAIVSRTTSKSRKAPTHSVPAVSRTTLQLWARAFSGKRIRWIARRESEFPIFNSGNAASINDGNLNTRVDTYSQGDPVSFVGIVWEQPVTRSVINLELTHALFSNGGWFGVPGVDPGPGGLLTGEHVVEPRVEITTDGGLTWTPRAATSNYDPTLIGVGIGGGAFPNPNRVTAIFTLASPVQNIDGIRLVGTNGGSVGGGFLGVFDLAVNVDSVQSAAPRLLEVTLTGGQFEFAFDSQSGVTHVVQVKNDLADANWQTHTTIPGDGTRKSFTTIATGAQRFFRVSNQQP